MNAIEDTPFRRQWEALGNRLPRPDSILCISAHWESRGVRLTSGESPETIHDFYGFPQALFDVQYPAPGNPRLALQCADLLHEYGATLDAKRGLDHGAWSVLKAMYPKANVPVVQLSLSSAEPGFYHYGIGRLLQPLRKERVLILGSGNIVHNLRLFDFRANTPFSWASELDEQVQQLVHAGDHKALMEWRELSAHSGLAIPTAEHYLPLLYTLGAQLPADEKTFFNTDVISSISMTSLVLESKAN